MSMHIDKLFQSDVFKRHEHHVTPSHESYPVVRHQARNLPQSQHVSINSFRLSTRIAPETTVPSGGLTGSGGGSNYSSWELSNTQLQMIENIYLEWNFSYSTTAAGDLYVTKPAWHMLDRVEFRLESGNSSIILEPNSQHILWMSGLTDEQYRNQCADYNMAATSRTTPLAFAAAAGSGESKERTLRIRLGSVFETSRIFGQGIDSNAEIRVYWDQAHSSVTGSPSAIALNSANLIVEESHVAREALQRQINIMSSPQGISFRFPDWRLSTFTFNGVSAGNTQSQILNSDVGYCSALLLLFRSTSKTGTAPFTYYNPTDISITDDKNQRLSMARMDSSYIQRNLWRQTDFAGQSVAEDVNAHLIPFGLSQASFQHHGHAVGGLYLNGRTKVEFTISSDLAALTNIEMLVVSCMHSFMTIRNNRVLMEKS